MSSQRGRWSVAPQRPSRFAFDRILRFSDQRVRTLYDVYLQQNRFSAYTWVAYMAVILANLPFLVQPEALHGKYGVGVQRYSHLMIGNYICAAIIISTSLLEKRLPPSAKDARTLAKILIVAFLQPITGTALLYFRCSGEPCASHMTLKEFYFCNAATGGIVPSDGFIGWLIFSIGYQILMPARFVWTLVSWAIGLVGIVLSIHMAVTSSGITSAVYGNSVLFLLYVLFLLLQFALERKNMREFLLQESKADVINLGDHEEYRRFVEISDSLQWGAGFFEPLWGGGGGGSEGASSGRGGGGNETADATNAFLFQRNWPRLPPPEQQRHGDTSSTSSLTDSFVERAVGGDAASSSSRSSSGFSFSDSSNASSGGVMFEEAGR